MSPVYAHVAGIPVEETVPQLLVVGVGVFATLQLVRERARQRVRRLRRTGRVPPDDS